MKRSITLLFLLLCLFGCMKSNTYDVQVHIKANSTETYIFSDEMITPTKSIVKITTGKGIGDSMICVVSEDEKDRHEFYTTPGLTNVLTLKKDTWYKIGVLNKDSYELDLDVKIQVEGVEVCIEDQ